MRKYTFLKYQALQDTYVSIGSRFAKESDCIAELSRLYFMTGKSVRKALRCKLDINNVTLPKADENQTKLF